MVMGDGIQHPGAQARNLGIIQEVPVWCFLFCHLEDSLKVRKQTY